MNDREIESRFKPVATLAAESDLLVNFDEAIAYESVAREIHEKLGILPTVGCEVEVMFSALFPEQSSRLLGDPYDPQRSQSFRNRVGELSGDDLAEYERLDQMTRPRFEATLKAGIPKGKDAYWEFANSPAYSWRTLGLELDFLMDYGLLPEGYQHSLHVTLGGIKTDHGAVKIINGLELLYADPDRVRRGTIENRFGQAMGWARCSSNAIHNGIRERPNYALDLGQEVGTEFRTLATDSKPSHNGSMRAAQLLGSMLLSSQNLGLNHHPAVEVLAKTWRKYDDSLKKLLGGVGLPADGILGPARMNIKAWNTWADCLEQRDSSESAIAESINSINTFLDTAEAAINDLSVR